jgi:hypothetical protein
MSLKAALRWFWYANVKNKKNIILIHFQVDFVLKHCIIISNTHLDHVLRLPAYKGGFGSTFEGILVDDTKNVVKQLYHIGVGQNYKCTNHNK